MSAVAIRAPRRRIGRTLVRDPVMTAVIAVAILIIVFALLGPSLTHWSPSAINVTDANQGPSGQHWLGTDYLGRDLFARSASSARSSLLAPAVVVFAATSVALAIALACAWFGGRVDMVLGRFMDILFAFPALLFALIAVGVFGVGIVAPVVALSIAYVPYLGRVLRVVAVRERHQPYIEACTLSGMSAWRISIRHLAPGLFPYALAQGTVAFGYALIDLAAISFIGLGLQPPRTDWGVMVAEAQQPLLNHQPQEALVAGCFIVLTVVTCNLLGERVAKRMELT